ncbi:MAG: hypothetical protein WC365_10080, partial [Candidatus Babeliales bacterium]
MKRICVITTSRADYGYLYWIMKDIQAKDNCEGDGSMELSVICPLNHQAWDNIVDEFRFIYPTEPINSIADYGRFYSECLNLFQRSY